MFEYMKQGFEEVKEHYPEIGTLKVNHDKD
jgi:hypothetical protein